MANKRNLYEILQVSPTASFLDIQTRYRKLALELHPDRNLGDITATAKFQELNNAWEVLKDAESRKDYDARNHSSETNADFWAGMEEELRNSREERRRKQNAWEKTEAEMRREEAIKKAAAEAQKAADEKKRAERRKKAEDKKAEKQKAEEKKAREKKAREKKQEKEGAEEGHEKAAKPQQQPQQGQLVAKAEADYHRNLLSQRLCVHNEKTPKARHDQLRTQQSVFMNASHGETLYLANKSPLGNMILVRLQYERTSKYYDFYAWMDGKASVNELGQVWQELERWNYEELPCKGSKDDPKVSPFISHNAVMLPWHQSLANVGVRNGSTLFIHRGL